MTIYISIFAVMLLSAALFKRQWLPYVLIMLFLILFAGLRGVDVGVDTPTYSTMFRDVTNGSWYSGIEPSWNLLNRMVGRDFGGDFTWLLTVAATLTVIPIFYVARKVSPYPFLSVFIYFALHFYCGSFNIMRQYVAISFVLVSFYMYSKNKMGWAIVFLAIAVSFHYSSLMAALAFGFDRIRLTPVRVVVWVVIALAIGTVVNDDVVRRLTFSEYSVLGYRQNRWVALLNILLWDGLILTILLTMKDDILNSFWSKVLMLSVLAFSATYTFHYSARAYVIFGIAQTIALPLYIKNSKFKGQSIPVIIVLVYCSFQFFRMLMLNANWIMPYYTERPLFAGM